MIRRSPAPAEPARSEPVWRFMAAYFARFLRRHMNALRLARWGAPRRLDHPGPLVVYCNHPSWWDAATTILLADRLLDAPDDQQTIGGLDVTVRRNAFGRQVDSFESQVDVAGVAGGPVHAVFIRAPWVEQAGEGVEVLGRVSGGPADGRIVAVRQGSVVATSFHPELTGDTRLHRFFVELVRQRPAEETWTAPTTATGEETQR